MQIRSLWHSFTAMLILSWQSTASILRSAFLPSSSPATVDQEGSTHFHTWQLTSFQILIQLEIFVDVYITGGSHRLADPSVMGRTHIGTPSSLRRSRRGAIYSLIAPSVTGMSHTYIDSLTAPLVTGRSHTPSLPRRWRSGAISSLTASTVTGKRAITVNTSRLPCVSAPICRPTKSSSVTGSLGRLEPSSSSYLPRPRRPAPPRSRSRSRPRPVAPSAPSRPSRRARNRCRGGVGQTCMRGIPGYIDQKCLKITPSYLQNKKKKKLKLGIKGNLMAWRRLCQ